VFQGISDERHEKEPYQKESLDVYQCKYATCLLFSSSEASSVRPCLGKSDASDSRTGRIRCSLLQSFQVCLQELRATGMADIVPKDVPVHGVGHSNGALMHALISSYYPQPVTSNVLMSFNNKDVAEAIPIPGLFHCLHASSFSEFANR
jgi:hypothetical protein